MLLYACFVDKRFEILDNSLWIAPYYLGSAIGQETNQLRNPILSHQGCYASCASVYTGLVMWDLLVRAPLGHNRALPGYTLLT